MVTHCRHAALLVSLVALLAGCDSAGPGRSAVSSAWLTELAPEQRADLLRPVTAVDWPARAVGGSDTLRLTVTTGKPGELVFGGEGDAELPVELRIDIRNAQAEDDRLTRLSYSVLDFYGRRVAADNLGEVAVAREGRALRRVTLDGIRDFGYYEVVATLVADGAPIVVRQGFAIVPRPSHGSPDATWFACPATVAAAPAARRMGCKVCYFKDLIARGAGITNLDERTPERQWTPRFDPSQLMQAVESFEQAGFTVIGHVGPAMDTPRAADTGAAAGLPKDPEQAAQTVAPLVEALDSVKDWDIVPVPLDTALCCHWELSAYLQTLIDSGSFAPGRTRWVSGSVRAVNDCFADPGSQTPRLGIRALRFTDFEDQADVASWTARRVGVDQWMAALKGHRSPASPQERAWQRMEDVLAVVAAGGDVEFPEATVLDPACTAALAVLMGRLEQATFHGEVWPELPTVRSPVFQARGRSLAVIWCDGPADSGAGGVLAIPDAAHLAVEDCLGAPGGMWRGRELVAPVGMGPIYVLSDRLRAADLAKALRRGHMAGLAPVAVRVGTITSPIGPQATIPVYVAGLTSSDVEVTLTVDGPVGWTVADDTRTVRVAPGDAERVEFRYGAARRSADNLYPVTVRATVGSWSTEVKQAARQAVAPDATVTVDGRLDEWDAVPPMTAALPVSHALESAAAAKPNAASGAPVAKVRVARDDEFLYVAVEAPRAAPLRRVRTVLATGTDEGNPWGDETVQIALSASGKSQPDYVLSLVPTTARPAVVRLLGPDMEPRNPLPGPPLAPGDEVLDARVAIIDADGRAVYEAAIPRKELDGLPWSRGATWHFDYLIDGPAGSVQWAREVGTFPWQWNRRTFFPIGRRSATAESELGFQRTAGE